MTTAIALGALIGLLLGGDGSILAVPDLVYGAAEPMAAAIPTSLLGVAISSATALLPRLKQRLVRWRIAAIVGGTGAAASFARTALNRLRPPRLILLGFAAVMILAGLRMLSDTHDRGGDCALPEGGVNWRGGLPKSMDVGPGVGFLTGLFGVGGGFVIIPAPVVLLGLSMPTTVATSLVIIVANSTAGLTAHAGDAAINYQIAGAFTSAAVTGSPLAGRFANRPPTARLQRTFAYLVLAIAVFVAVERSSPPSAVFRP